MIQLGGKLSLIALIICFCLFQRGFVYGEGVSIDFSSVTYGGIQINTSTWGNTNIPSSPPTTPTPITPSMPTSTGTSSTSTYSSTQTQTINSSISSNLNNLTSSYQKLNNSTTWQSGYYNPSYVPTELNKELIRSATFSPLSEKEPLLPDAEPYIVTVCLPFNNTSIPGCFDKVNSEQASEKLAGILLNRYFNGTVSRPFRVIFPLVMPIKEQKNSLHQIEIQAIAIVESLVFNADGAFIKEYNKIAREEAKIGVNWSHTLKDEKSINEFQTKKAFTKLNNIAIQEKNLISKNFKIK